MAILLLDSSLYPGLAFSFRKLRTAYAGNCIKIRRSSDSTEQDIGFSSDVVDTSAIASFIGGGQGFISRWYDQSGNATGFDLIQATGGNQPEYIASGIGSKPTARFTAASSQSIQGTDFTKRQTDITLCTETTLHAVVNQTAGTGGTIWGCDYTILNTNNHTYYLSCWDGAEDEIRWDFGHGNRDQFHSGLGTTAPIPAGWGGNPHVIQGFCQSDGSAGLEVDGTSIKTGTFRGRMSSVSDSAQPSTYPASIGSSFAYGAYWTGDISEVIVFKVGLNANRRDFVLKNAKAFYGIS